MPKSSIPTEYTKDIANQVASRLKLSKKDATAYTEEVINIIADRLVQGVKINLKGLGILAPKQFPAKEIPARMVRNPRDGTTSEKPAQSKPAYRKLTFKMAKIIQQRLN